MKWGWNAFHYAAANGEIIAFLVLLYSKSFRSIQLSDVLDENILQAMVDKFKIKTRSPISTYTLAELANKHGYSEMEKKLNDCYQIIEWQLKMIKG